MKEAERIGPALLVGVTLESSHQDGQAESLTNRQKPKQGEKDESVAGSEGQHHSAEEQERGSENQALLHTELIDQHTNKHRVDAEQRDGQSIRPGSFRIGKTEVSAKKANQDKGRSPERVRLEHLDDKSHPQFTRLSAQRLEAPAERVENRDRHVAHSTDPILSHLRHLLKAI